MDKERKKIIDDHSDQLFTDFLASDSDITEPRMSDGMLSEILLRTGLDSRKSGHGRTDHKRTGSFRFSGALLLRYAAMLLLPFAAGLSVYGIMTKRATERSVASAEQVAEIVSEPGQRASAILPDGTEVWLSSGSRISYSMNFNETNRDVALSGEAYFDVTKNEKIPFRVNAGDLKITVLGTEFNVKAYDDAGTVSATLVRGSIEALTPTGSYRQSPDQKIVYDRNSGTTQIFDVVDAGAASSWKRGILHYDNQALKEIAEDLRRIYGVNVVFRKQELAQMKFSGSIPGGYSDIGTVLRYISIAASLNCRYDDNTVVIDRE